MSRADTIARDLQAVADANKAMLPHLKNDAARARVSNQVRIIESSIVAMQNLFDDIAAANSRDLKDESRLHEKILRLEAICLLHGITDLHFWLQKPSGYLMQMIMENERDGATEVPRALYKTIFGQTQKEILLSAVR